METKCIICNESLDSQEVEERLLPICEKCFEIALKVIKAYSKLLDE